MKVTLQVEIKPFLTPNFVLAEQEPVGPGERMQETVKYPLSYLNPETLDRLCDQFRDEIFMKAGKQQPERQA